MKAIIVHLMPTDNGYMYIPEDQLNLVAKCIENKNGRGEDFVLKDKACEFIQKSVYDKVIEALKEVLAAEPNTFMECGDAETLMSNTEQTLKELGEIE